MQEMDVDEDVFDYLPSVVRKNMIYHNRIYTNAKTYTDFVISGGQNPVLYELKGKQILSSFHLNTVFKDITLPSSMSNTDDLNISIKLYFSYKKRVKELFFFFRIDNKLAVLGKIDQQFKVFREFDSITAYDITDLNCTGESNVEIEYVDGTNQSLELASLSHSNKGIDLRVTSCPNGELDKMTQGLREKVTKLSCELYELNIQIQKQLHEYQTYCQTVDSNDNLSILSRYGDFWIRNINNHILIGIPVYNSSANKNLVEKIRVSIFASNRQKLTYTQKLYSFQSENETIEPLKLQEICEQTDDNPNEFSKQNTDNENEMNFNQEWIHQKQFVLYPDNAAIIIIKMDLKDFDIEANGCEFEIFALYKVFMESGTWKELQTYLSTVKIDPDILHDQRYFVSFEPNKLYQDLLAVIATTERRMYRLKFEDDTHISQLQEFLLKRLSFDSISTSLNIEDNYRYFLSQNLDLTTSMNTEEDHQMFYCQQDGYWNGTLIRMRAVKGDDKNESGETYELKIYNSDPIKIKNLIAAFRNEFYRKITFEPLGCCNQPALELELAYRFREECNALNDLATNLKYKTNKVRKCYDNFIESQHRTDIIWAELINEPTEE